jgi:hypothetical protein
MFRTISVHETAFTGSNGYAYGTGWKASDSDTSMHFSAVITEFVWSPCLWRGGVRKKENFLGAYFCVLDFDGETTLEQAHDIFLPYVCLIGATKSHTPDKHRFRVILVFERPITDVKKYEYNMHKYTEKFKSDPKAVDAARMFFPCVGEILANKGAMLPVFEMPQPKKPFTPKEYVDKVTGEVIRIKTKSLKHFDDFGAFTEKERNSTIFNIAYQRAKDGHSLSDSLSYMIPKTSLDERESRRTIESAYKTAGK